MIFLGGTIGANNWRTEIVIPALIERGVPAETLFNPVVEHWDRQAQEREDEVKHTADYLFYVLASPDPHGQTSNVSAYSLVEATMHLYDASERTIVVLDTTGMPRHTTKAMTKAINDLRKRFPNAPIFDDYASAIEYLVQKLT
jgi:uncharacterized phage-like protein YoqJ